MKFLQDYLKKINVDKQLKEITIQGKIKQLEELINYSSYTNDSFVKFFPIEDAIDIINYIRKLEGGIDENK